MGLLANVCAGPNLRILDVSGNAGITNEGLSSLLGACPNVSSLFIYDTQVSDACVLPLIRARECYLEVVGPSKQITRDTVNRMRQLNIDVREPQSEGMLFTDITAGICSCYSMEN
mmetsp:Transcript_22494/g.65405  ORF Transcript_22494/g.65405 Transcript_22494/m.65405 type:complete len:115 (-) Transcript_22494:112-456(-)